MDDTISRRAAIEAVHKEFDECLVWDESGKYTADEVERILTDVPSVQPEKMQLSEEDATFPVEGTTLDCISRQQAILCIERNAYRHTYVDQIVDIIKWLPSAQPEHTETHSCENQRTETHESRREWYMKGYRDAQDAAMHESCTDCPLYDHDKHNCPRFNRVIPATIEEVKPMWIPVTERLPRDDEDVIVTCLDDSGDTPFSYTTVAWHYNGMWVCENERCPFVVAWMPLPTSYRENEDE